MKNIYLVLIFLASFKTMGQGPIAYYNFNNTLNPVSNINSSTTIVNSNSNATNSFSAGRDGAATGGLNINTFTDGDIYNCFPNNMPVGNDSRTISMWVKYTNFRLGVTKVTLFGQGNQAAGEAFGLDQGDFNNLSDLTFFKWGTDYQGTFTPSLNTWYHYVIQYDNNGGSNGKIKVTINGTTIINNVNVGVLNTVGSGLRIGASSASSIEFEGVVDDLTIYNRTISQGELEVLQGTRQPGEAPNLYQQTLNGITSNSANFNYNLEANNASSTATIRWGTTSGTYTNSASGTEYSAPLYQRQAQTIALSGLAANTTYYYRAEVTNVFGSTTYNQGSFTTSAPVAAPVIPNGVSDMTVDQIGLTSYRINYKVNPNGALTTVRVAQNVDAINTNFNNNTAVNIIVNAGTVTGTGLQNMSTIVTGVRFYSYINFIIEATNSGGTTRQNDNLVNSERTLNPYSFASTMPFSQQSATSTSVVFRPTIETMGQEGAFYLEYSANNGDFSNNNRVAAKTLIGPFSITDNNASGPTTFNIPVTGLLPNTTYYFNASVDEPTGGEADAFSTTLPNVGYSGTFTTAGALPLNLLSFSAQKLNNQVRLQWETANEKNVEGFDIEQSSNGQEFSKIAIIAAQNTAKGKYSYLHEGTSGFFRLKMKDFDGAVTYSKVVSVAKDNDAASYTVYPNPVTSNCTIKLNNEQLIGSTALVYNLQGKVITKLALQNTTTTLDLSQVPAGRYLVKTADGKAIQVQKQ
jgi:hypothetical protein